jgi:hypothetical protein
MGVDYMIGHGCVPKEQFTSDGLLLRVKAGERAAIVREFYKLQHEQRRDQDMGFELTRSTAAGEEDTQLIRLDDLTRLYKELEGYEQSCVGCPANGFKKDFGCIGSVNYPISGRAEVWMLQRLPNIDEPIPFLLLQQGRDLGNTGQRAAGLRSNQPGVFFQSPEVVARQYEEFDVTGEQMFELLFLLGAIQPKRAVLILMFMGAIQRDLPADELMAMTPAPPDAAEKYPFLLKPEDSDDQSIRDLRAFFRTLYLAWQLDRDVLLDV